MNIPFLHHPFTLGTRQLRILNALCSFGKGMADKSSVSRAPGFLERYYICRDTMGTMGRGFNISAQLSEAVSDLLLSNALRHVILSCPYLTVNAFRNVQDHVSDPSPESLFGTSIDSELDSVIAEDAVADGKNYQIRSLNRILYSDVVSRKNIQKFDESTLEMLSKIRLPVNREKPMWYLSITHEASTGHEYLTFACNHVTFDGRSAVNFFEDLVKALEEVSQYSSLQFKETLYDLSLDSPGVLPEPSEVITELYNPPIGFTLSTLVSHLAVPKFVSKFVASYFSPASPNFYQFPHFQVAPFDGKNVSKFRLVKFTPQEVRSILSLCKKQNTTLTPIMASVLHQAIEVSFKPHFGSFSQSCELMICGRRFYPGKEQDTRYGIFVSAFTSYIIPESSIGDAAKKLAHGLHQAMETRSTFYRAGLLKLVGVWEYLKSYSVEKEERHTFEISNLGRADLAAGKWHVTNAIFSQGVTFAHITLSVISTSEGGMNIAIAFHEKLLEYAENDSLSIDRCIANFKETLLRD